jgi:hypothetical protein
MESNYRNRDFEHFVKQNADQYRMFPSEKVWKNIHGTLHTRRKWYGFGLALLLLSTVSAVTWVMVSNPSSEIKQITATTPASGQVPGSKTASAKPSSPEIVATDLPFGNKPAIPSGTSPIVDFVSTANHVSIEQDMDLLDEIAEEAGINNSNEKGQFMAVITAPRVSSVEINSDNTIAAITPVVESFGLTGTELHENDQVSKPAETAVVNMLQAQEELNYPLTIESVTNTYRGKQRKINWQLYITPTVSYRKLAVNKSLESFTTSNPSFALASLSDVDKAVTHKPDMGAQVGLSGSYPMTKNLKVRAGFQFNITRYDVKASLNNLTQASFDLNGANGGIDAYRPSTHYRNYSGSKYDWLKNYYFSVSIPIGVELTLLGSGKNTSLGVAGTIQPTYTIKDRAYMISTDFKNYATIPWLMRDVNVSTGFEMFVNYNSGGARWQIGPQVRYQILSSFHNKYPVKENLFDFGMKIGVSLNQ